jgi:putative membrane protein
MLARSDVTKVRVQDRDVARASSPCLRLNAQDSTLNATRAGWMPVPRWCLCLLLIATTVPLLAHEVGPEAGEGPSDVHQLWRTWGWEPGTLIGLAISGIWYGAGLWRTWRAAGAGHGIRRWEAWSFAGGSIVLFIALVSPLHPLGQVLFSAHMTQHELLMLVAAPLLVLGRPMIAFLRALPGEQARSLGRFSNTMGWQALWGGISNPFVAWLIHLIVLWAWHAPSLFQATLHSEWVHAAQHVSFLTSALLFWWALIHGRPTATSQGVAVLYLFTTAIHSGLLGALLTFARVPWYPAYGHGAESWGLSPLEDQQLGGLIMWVPACTVYVVAGLALFAAWMRESERRLRGREQHRLPIVMDTSLNAPAQEVS